MPEFISFESLIMPSGSKGVLFPTSAWEFLFRPSVEPPSSRERNEMTQSAPEHPTVVREKPLIQLPSIRVSKPKVKVLQRWTGRVERVMGEVFVAVISDLTNPSNPPEELELDLQEVSETDRPLIVEGAAFYWSIVYRDTEGGQRERLATLRFARQPILSQADIHQIYKEADEMVTLLESA